MQKDSLNYIPQFLYYSYSELFFLNVEDLSLLISFKSKFKNEDVGNICKYKAQKWYRKKPEIFDMRPQLQQ